MLSFTLFYSTTLYSEKKSQSDENEESIEQRSNIILVDDSEEEETLPFLNHCRKILKRAVKGAKKGQDIKSNDIY